MWWFFIVFCIMYDPWRERFIHRHFNGLSWFRDDLYFVHASGWREEHVQHCIFVAHVIATKLKKITRFWNFKG